MSYSQSLESQLNYCHRKY